MSLSKIFRNILFWIRKRRTGKVKFFNYSKGYGFIRCKRLRKDIFVHATNINKRISRGDLVVFKLIRTARGWEAKDVRPLNV
ncbi:MAG: cold shock domain-containing protein [Bacteroidota bacterium]